MYNRKQIKYEKSRLTSIETVEGETIEEKCRRLVHNKEPIKDGAPEIFTARKDGVGAAYNVRTDRWEIATEAMDKVQGSIEASREEKSKTKPLQIVKYINKTDKIHKEYNSKILTSPGIGKEYMNRKDWTNNKYNEKKTNETYKTRQGIKLALPIYYRNKIYNEEEREKLWLNKLDEEVRWINGIKIDISKNEDIYYKRLKEERIINDKYGYGNNKINWERRKYENERRKLKKTERYAKRGKKR